MSHTPVGFLAKLNFHAEAHGTRPAFRLAGADTDMVLDFATLRDRVQRLGTGIHAAAGEGARVAICMENRPAWPVAYLAIWYAGATVVPIDPALEAHAIRRVLKHSRAVILLSSHQLSAKIQEAIAGLDAVPEVLDVDADKYFWDGDAPEGFPAPAGEPCGPGWTSIISASDGEWAPCPDNTAPATTMYTSGTTGSPKGVVLNQAAIHANVLAGLERVDLRQGDHVLGVLPLFHALPLMTNFLAPMYVGAEVTYLTELNPERIIAAFPRFGITLFACVPLFFYRFHDKVMQRLSGLSGVRRRVAFCLLRLNRFLRARFGVNLGPRFFAAAHAPFGPKLRTFLSGGAKFDARVCQDFIDLGFTFVQGYGLTEACAGLTAHPAHELRADTVGRPLDGVEVRIDSANSKGVGEIVARGPNLMAGYFENEAATAEVIVDGWLRTGDLGRLLPDGHLQVTGRAKDMIVLASGKNIYPEELEDYYGQSPLISEMCILGIADPRRRGAERLHAIVVPDLEAARARGQVNLREEITWAIEGLGLSLPSPQRLTSLEIRMEPLPRTTTRKLKRFEMKNAILERGNRGEGPAAETEATEAPRPDDTSGEADWMQVARSILAQHARVDSVSVQQHLDIDLGMESLERVELQADLEDALGIKVPQEAAGGIQTVGELFEVLEQHGAGKGGRSAGRKGSWARVLMETPAEVEPYLHTSLLVCAPIFAVGRGLRLLQSLVGLRVAGLENIPHDYPFMLAPNHLSYTDPFILGLTLPWRVYRRTFFVGYSAYFRGPVMGTVGKILRTVPIDQNRGLEAAMQAAAAGLRRSMVLGIFPEGARSGDGTVKEFRRGAGILARELGTPIVPIGIWGTYEMWPRQGKFKPHAAAVVYGEPMMYPGDGTEPADFMDAVRDRVVELVAEAEKIGRS
jgi:long-chain acyl-CoA synthetase